MATACVTDAQRETARKNCLRPYSESNLRACLTARLPGCPTEEGPPVVEVGKDGINLLGVYQICNPKPTLLAPYPPGSPVGNEAQAQAELERLRTQIGAKSATLLKLRFRGERYRKLNLGTGFWVGLGLAGVGGALLFFRR